MVTKHSLSPRLNSTLTPIRSFARREGRLTPRQRNAMSANDNGFLIDIDSGMLNMATLFGRAAPLTLEIGFGMGHALLTMATLSPNSNFIGIDVYRPGIGTLLAAIQENNLQNIRILAADAQHALPASIPDHSLDRVNIFFPDPWPKTRHHKRRLIQPGFISLIEKKLKPGGYLHLATDWEDYAIHMLETLNAAPYLRNTSANAGFAESRQERPKTKYEQRGLNLGHQVWDLIFQSVVEN